VDEFEALLFITLPSLAVAAWAGWLTIRDRSLSDPLFYTVATLEAVLVIQVVFGFVDLAMTDREVDGVTYTGYQLTMVLVYPIGFAWGASDKSRWGPGVLVISSLVVIVLAWRLVQIWDGVGA
jgi:hypothetical protein